MATDDLLKKLEPYKAPMEQPVGRRIAHLLDWAAVKLPGKWIPVHYVVRFMMGYDHTPRMANEEVQRVRKMCSTNVRRILEREYSRELLHQTGVGVRATVDSADVLKHKLPQRAARFNNARAALENTAARVDVKDLPNTKEMAPWKAWFEKSVMPVVKTLKAQGVETKLLPPGDEEG